MIEKKDMTTNLKIMRNRLDDLRILGFPKECEDELRYIESKINNIQYGYISLKLKLTEEQLKLSTELKTRINLILIENILKKQITSVET